MQQWFYRRHMEGLEWRLWYAERCRTPAPMGRKPWWWTNAPWYLRVWYELARRWNMLTKGYWKGEEVLFAHCFWLWGADHESRS